MTCCFLKGLVLKWNDILLVLADFLGTDTEYLEERDGSLVTTAREHLIATAMTIFFVSVTFHVR